MNLVYGAQGDRIREYCLRAPEGEAARGAGPEAVLPVKQTLFLEQEGSRAVSWTRTYHDVHWMEHPGKVRHTLYLPPSHTPSLVLVPPRAAALCGVCTFWALAEKSNRPCAGYVHMYLMVGVLSLLSLLSVLLWNDGFQYHRLQIRAHVAY